jgi:predicted ATPase/DNA-binding SARP family transcriptional activator
VRLAVLGPVELTGESGRAVEPPSPLAKRLLVALALAPAGALSAAALAETIWESDPPRNPRAALQTLVSRIRGFEGGHIVESTPTGYRVDPDLTDLAIARRSASAVAALPPVGAVAETTRTLGLWRGVAGADLDDCALGVELLETAGEIEDDLRRARAASHLALSDPVEALDDLDLLSARHPFDESLQAQRLRALAGAGRRAEALAAFAAFREFLGDQLGSEPGAALVEAHTALLREDGAASTLRVGIRHAATSLIGRDADVAAVAELTRSSRLTTILGAGGLGKTRLAQRVAADDSRPGVAFVELVGVSDPADLPVAIASTLGIAEARVRRSITDPVPRTGLDERIRAALRERPTLLVLDNCEHLIDGVAAWVDEALQTVADLVVLATSRSPLAVEGERVYPLEPLAADGSAAQLFRERATAVRPNATLPDDAVARLCRRLDGLPLAIELAAARMRSMSITEIEERLDERFALLTSTSRTTPERHRTLLAVIEWSRDLLTAEQQRVLRRLSVFPDGFTAEAARMVAADPPADQSAGATAAAERDPSQVAAALEAIVQQSLVEVTESPHTGRIRYRMLATVREFGERELRIAGETEAVRGRLRDWAVVTSIATSQQLRGDSLIDVVHRIEDEQENLLAVFRAALEAADAEAGLVVFGVLAQFWTMRAAHSEVVGLAPALLDLDPRYSPTPTAADASATAMMIGGITLLVSGVPSGLRLVVRLRKLIGDGLQLDPVLAAQVQLALLIARPTGLAAEIERQRGNGDPRIAAFAEITAGQFAENLGRPDEALAALRRGWDLADAVANEWGRAMASQGIAYLHSQSRRPAETLQWARIARNGLDRLDARADRAQLDWVTALAHVSLGHFDQAREILESLASETNDLGLDGEEIRLITTAGFADVAAAEGQFDSALALYSDALGRDSVRPAMVTPWHFMSGAACLAFAANAGIARWTDDDLAWLASIAARIRSGALREFRMRGENADRPIMAAIAAGYSTWLATRASASEADRERAVTLLALAEELHARQDLPSLDLAAMRRTVAAVAGEGTLDRAREEASAMSGDTALARLREVLSVPLD